MKKVEKGRNQSKRGDQKAAFNIEPHEAEVTIGEFTSQRASEGNNHCRKTDKGQREGGKAKEVVRFCRCHERILVGIGLTRIASAETTKFV